MSGLRRGLALALSWGLAHAVVPIGDLHRNDEAGYPLPPYGIGTEVEVAGVVTVPTGVFSSIRTEIYVQDATGGILVYRSDRVFPVTLGDSVVVRGTVGQYRGTTQIVPIAVEVVARATPPAPSPTTCQAIAQTFLPDGTEPDESRLVRVEWASYDPSTGMLTDQWGSCLLSLDPDAGVTVPAGTWHITGVIKQWDDAPPYREGYQLVPRFPTDVTQAQGPRFVEGPWEGEFVPDGFTVRWTTDVPAAGRLSWGLQAPGDCGTAVDSTLAPSHCFVVRGLEPATIYTLQAVAWNAQGMSMSPSWRASTASGPGCTGSMEALFTQSVAPEYATGDTAVGGAALERRLVDRIHAARFSIDACLFNLTLPNVATALIQAKNRGVRVRVIVEADNWNSQVDRLVGAGIPVLADTAGPNAGTGAMHHKFFVFDFMDRSCAWDDYVWTGSANATSSGFSQNAENVLLIQDQALAGAFTAEFEEMWGSSGPLPDAQRARFGTRKTDNIPHRFLVGSSSVELAMSPSDGTTSWLLHAMSRAQRALYFCIYGFTNSQVEQGFRVARDRGVRVAGVFDSSQVGPSSCYWTMSGQGPGAWNPPADVHLLGTYPATHHKYLLVDADNAGGVSGVATGSFNWSWAAESSNDENLIIVWDSRIANHYLQEFMARYREAGGVDSLAQGVGEHPVPGGRLALWPCPVTAPELTVRGVPMVTVRLLDLVGRVVWESPESSPTWELRVAIPPLAPGVYTLEARGPLGRATSPLVVLRRW